MNAVREPCPSNRLSDVQIVLELFRTIRDLGLTTGAELMAECEQMFPDLPDERRQVCFEKLARMLEKNQ